ncbi:MAG: hypothetical protein COW71_02820 [Ignavibacteriales bacterium CG18_big_fil_WC_8_21_14_2_50_31_20]|nr:MAG: hypothetical protein COW71_02820 [Ignavibacteriales bacterium CG18_big_fil_WC_8_21_14_2_50_31_20]
MKLFTAMFLISMFVGCGENELEKNTRAEYSAIIRRINTNYNSMASGKENESKLTVVDCKEFYGRYSRKFSDIRDDLAGAASADKFSEVRRNLDSILTVSVKYIINRWQIFENLVHANNIHESHIKNMTTLTILLMNINYDNYYKLKALVENIIKDSSDYYAAYNPLSVDINVKEKIKLELIKLTLNGNIFVKKFEFHDSLELGEIQKDSLDLLTVMWKKTKVTEVSPTKDLEMVRDFIKKVKK